MILADEIEKLCEPKGLGIIVKAQHYCMKWRGVKEPNTSMITVSYTHLRAHET